MVSFLTSLVELAPQAIDEDVDDVGQQGLRVAPDLAGDHLARDGLSAVPHQVCQKVEFAAAQFDFVEIAGRAAGDHVEPQVSSREFELLAGRLR
jgi:hypothetical protein